MTFETPSDFLQDSLRLNQTKYYQTNVSSNDKIHSGHWTLDIEPIKFVFRVTHRRI